MKLALLFVFFALSVAAQSTALTNNPAAIPDSPAGQGQTNQSVSFMEPIEQIRMVCIAGRRHICGKILKVLPDGLVIDSGYTNLLREPLAESWLVPGILSESRASNVIEENQPGAICYGLVFLTDLPKMRGPVRKKPQLYDYVIIEGYPAGQYIYTSVGSVQRNIRRFSASLNAAVGWKYNNDAGKSAQ